MFKKFLRRLLMVICISIVVAAGVFLGLSIYYSKGFPAFTWINSVYCTGKSVEEVNQELLLTAKAPVLTIKDIEGNTYEIDMDKVGFCFDYTQELFAYATQLEYASWLERFRSGHLITMEPQISFQEELLRESFFDMSFVKEEMADEGEVSIEKDDTGYVLVNTLERRLDWNSAYDYVLACALRGQMEVDLAEGNCYQDFLPSAKQRQTLDLWDKLQAFLQCDIVYDMGDALIPVDKTITAEFVLTDATGNFLLDEAGDFVLNEAGVEAFIAKLAEEYNTVGTDLTFQSTRGDVITVPYKKYGTKLNSKAECAYLKKAFLEKKAENHVPAYSQEGYVRGKNDIGFTYIEIDMTQQKIYLYVDGELKVEADVVTGNEKRKMSTPEGVNFVYAKQRNRILRGDNYAAFVNYWMPVNGGIGIHDATWRKKFGGEIYKTDGSHGCINVPKDKMIEIYDLVDVGTPVVMFY